MDKRQVLNAILQGDKSQIKEALTTIKAAAINRQNWLKSIENNLTASEQKRYFEICDKVTYEGLEPVFDNLSNEELDELLFLTEKREKGVNNG